MANKQLNHGLVKGGASAPGGRVASGMKAPGANSQMAMGQHQLPPKRAIRGQSRAMPKHMAMKGG